MTPVASLSEAVNNPITIEVKKSSTIIKIISCVPLVGILSSTAAEDFLDKKIPQTSDITQIVELIKEKNHYKIADIIRNLLSTAFIVANIAVGVFSIVPAVAVAAVLVVLTVEHSYNIYCNNKIVNELQTSGLRRGIEVR